MEGFTVECQLCSASDSNVCVVIHMWDWGVSVEGAYSEKYL